MSVFSACTETRQRQDDRRRVLDVVGYLTAVFSDVNVESRALLHATVQVNELTTFNQSISQSFKHLLWRPTRRSGAPNNKIS